ncbi:hypothetical protein B0A72_17365 [Flavobacterium pectinovorum]|uniref:Uncharacterized protein n=1 Tax=Flavobacterium pectinovorum TaxID=29533 RepID=A0AB36NY83_9FLAO|nr:hypothetical protein B0A72_17365 [Flavobacterium pectinovorum]
MTKNFQEGTKPSLNNNIKNPKFQFYRLEFGIFFDLIQQTRQSRSFGIKPVRFVDKKFQPKLEFGIYFLEFNFFLLRINNIA